MESLQTSALVEHSYVSTSFPLLPFTRWVAEERTRRSPQQRVTSSHDSHRDDEPRWDQRENPGQVFHGEPPPFVALHLDDPTIHCSASCSTHDFHAALPTDMAMSRMCGMRRRRLPLLCRRLWQWNWNPQFSLATALFLILLEGLLKLEIG